MTSTDSHRAPAPEAEELPFAGLLFELRARGFPVGVREHQQVVRLAKRWRGVDHAAFGDAIAALLARDADEVQRIRAAFNDWAGASVEPPQPKSPAPTQRVSRIHPWHVALLLLLLVVAVAVFVKTRINEQRATRRDTVAVGPVSQRPPPSTPPVPETPPPLPSPPRKPAREIPWLLGAVMAALALLVLAVWRARARRGDWLRGYRLRVLEQKPGPHRFEYKVRPFAPPLPAADIDDVASILGRAFDTTSNGDTLDVEESLRETLREGLRPQLVFERPPRNVPILILQDIAWQMRPWQRKVDFFVSELARQGVRLEVWYFEGSPMLVSRDPRGRMVPFETLTARQSDASLMIVSTGQGMNLEAAEELAHLLAKWSFRTWLNPIGNPSYWRRGLSMFPLRMWPMTGGGVRAAAVEVSRKREIADVPAGSARRGITRADVERLQQLIALVPHPSLELAAELRVRFCGEIPEEVLLFLGEEGVFYGDTIRFSDEQLKRLVAEMQRDPEQARRVREYLLEVLRDSEPPAASVAHLRWQIEYAVHELHAPDATRAADARRMLHQLAQGPLGDEVEAALELAGAPKDDEVMRAARGLPHRIEATGLPRPPMFSSPRLPLAAVALLLVGAATWIGASRWPAGAGDPIPHRLGSYTLREQPGTPNYIASAAADDAPLQAAIYRNGRLWRPVSVSPPAIVPIADSERDAWFDVRGRLAEGNLAASSPVWVPRTQGRSSVVPPPGPTPNPAKTTATVTLAFTVSGVGPQRLRYRMMRTRGSSFVDGVGGTPVEVPPGSYDVVVAMATGAPVVMAGRTPQLLAGQTFFESYDIDLSSGTATAPAPPPRAVEEPLQVAGSDTNVAVAEPPQVLPTDTNTAVGEPPQVAPADTNTAIEVPANTNTAVGEPLQVAPANTNTVVGLAPTVAANVGHDDIGEVLIFTQGSNNLVIAVDKSGDSFVDEWFVLHTLTRVTGRRVHLPVAAVHYKDRVLLVISHPSRTAYEFSIRGAGPGPELPRGYTVERTEGASLSMNTGQTRMRLPACDNCEALVPVVRAGDPSCIAGGVGATACTMTSGTKTCLVECVGAGAGTYACCRTTSTGVSCRCIF